VMGGSAAFDQNVSDLPDAEPRSWPNRAQAALRPHGHTRVEVINGGVPGHGSIDVIARLQSEIWLYQPDVVVLYNAWNDIKYFRAFEISPDDPPYSVLRTYDPSADPFRSYRNGMDRILARSQIYMKLRNRYFSTRLDAGAEGIRPEGEVGSGYGRFGPEQYELNIRSFVDIVRNMGAVPVLATQAALVSPDNDEEQRARMGYDYQLLDHPSLVAAFEDTYRIVRSVAVEESVPLLDAAAAMNGRSEYFTDHVHLSDEGSRVLAELLADRLTSVLELERGQVGQRRRRHAPRGHGRARL
jgi:lysophospholipase L1-like esterase